VPFNEQDGQDFQDKPLEKGVFVFILIILSLL